jgi:succinate dehydrogenase / fumarate reductase membrane anchor subunit
MSLRSPLRNVTHLGSARGGASHWYAQRVTAVALVLLGLWLVVSLATFGGVSHERVVAWLSSPVAAALAVLLVLTAAWHAVLGLQVVIEDYVHHPATELVLHFLTRAGAWLGMALGIVNILKIALGA